MDINRKCILVADDDSSINRLISFKLEKEGYKVISCTDGKAALETALNEEIDAAVLDIMMPYLDGIQVLKQIREKKRTLPVIMLSVKSQDHDMHRGMELGANDYLTKPFQPSELVEKINKLLGDS